MYCSMNRGTERVREDEPVEEELWRVAGHELVAELEYLVDSGRTDQLTKPAHKM